MSKTGDLLQVPGRLSEGRVDPSSRGCERRSDQADASSHYRRRGYR